MNSVTTERFRRLYAAAGAQRQAQIKRAYRLWQENPSHPSIRFKKVHDTEPIYSARVDLHWRAVGVLEGDTVVWFWVGPHDGYDALLKRIVSSPGELPPQALSEPYVNLSIHTAPSVQPLSHPSDLACTHGSSHCWLT